MIMERLFTKAYFDLPIYSNDLGKRRDFGVIERDIAAAYPDRRYIPIQTSDVRFDHLRGKLRLSRRGQERKQRSCLVLS